MTTIGKDKNAAIEILVAKYEGVSREMAEAAVDAAIEDARSYPVESLRTEFLDADDLAFAATFNIAAL